MIEKQYIQHLACGLLSASIALSFAGCGVDAPSDPPELHNQANDALPDGGDGTADVGDDGLGEDGGEELDAGDDGGESLEEILETCGDIDFEQPDAELLSLTLNGLPIVSRGTRSILGLPVSYTVNAIGTLGIKSTLRQSVSTTAFQVTASPALAQGIAETEVNKRAGTTTTEFMPKADRGTLVDRDKAWEGIVCTVQPAQRITSKLGGGTVITAFDPPLPVSVSPKADLGRYAAELATARTWSNVKATVISSDNPDIGVGTIATGTVTVAPISPALTVTLDDGSSINITADLAFEVRANFGTPATTNNLGVKPITRFYVDNQHRVYKAIVADVQDGIAPPAAFVTQR